MQLSAEEAQEQATVSSKPDNSPRYPCGLTLRLDDDSMSKLGMAELPAVGAVLTMRAKVVVTSVGMHQQQDGEAENCSELQITDMELAGAAGPSTASVLYGG